MKRYAMLAMTAALCFALSYPAQGHCQIPCGIYTDELRFDMFREHITTLEKSMKQIEELSKDPGANANQLIRWTINKDDHADAFSEIVTEYFLRQRIAPLKGDEDQTAKDAYLKKITLCHEMLVYTMKTKQTTDLAHVEKLKKLVDEFQTAYFEGKEHEGHS